MQEHDEPQPSGKREIMLLRDALPSLNESFIIRHKIGEGTFSSVYMATLAKCPKKIVAIKHLIPTTHPTRIAMELECMQKFGGRNNVMQIYSCLRQGVHFVMIMPFFLHHNFQNFFDKMDLNEIRHYLHCLLVALECVHEGGVIHRDIKPSNFLYNRKLKRCALIDFGLAQYVDTGSPPLDAAQTGTPTSKRLKTGTYERTIGSSMNRSSPWSRSEQYCVDSDSSSSTPSAKTFLRLMPSVGGLNGQQVKIRSSSSVPCECFGREQVCKTCLHKPPEIAPRAGTPGYRSPEVLLKQRKQTTAVDIWSVGVIFLSLLSKRYPVFVVHDDMSALAEIMSLFGTDAVRKFAATIGKTVTCSPELPSQDLARVCDENGRNCSQEMDEDRSAAYDLLVKLLALDPNLRISAADALRHPFFSTDIPETCNSANE